MFSTNNNSDLQTRYNLFSLQSQNVAQLDKAFLQIPIKTTTEANPDFVEAFLLLEWLAAQRPFVKQFKFVNPTSGRWLGKIKSSSFGKGRSQVLQVLFHVTARKNALTSLINFLSVSFAGLRDKYLSIDANISLNSCFFFISSVDFLAIRPEYLKLQFFTKLYFFLYIDALLKNKHQSSSNRYYFIRDVWARLFPELNLLQVSWQKIYDQF